MTTQDFDFVHESDRTTIVSQVKMPSLSDYDNDRSDEAENWLDIALARWGDRRVAA